MAFNSEPTRTDDTIDRYRLIGDGIVRRFEREAGISWRDDPYLFVDWINAERRTWAKSTWRLYKQGLKQVFTESKAPISLLKSIEAPIEREDRPRYANGHAKPVKDNPSTRVKAIKDSVLQAYVNVLMESRSRMANITVAFLMINREIGLRPIEWETMRYDNDRQRLIVQNAKNTNGRSTGSTREIILSPQVSSAIESAIELRDQAIEYCGGWQESLLKMRALMKGIRHYHDLPRMQLYSTRHQFAADLKSSGLTKRQVADLMGHASEDIAGTHYGRATHGRGFVSVEPVSNLELANKENRPPERKNENSAKG